MAGPASIEAEDELVEIGLEMHGAQTVVDAERLGLEVGEDAMDPGQDDMGRHGADHVGLVGDLGSFRL